MAHDFAKKRKTKKKTQRRKKPQDQPWRNFAAGLIVGVILGPILYLAMVADGSDSAATIQSSQPGFEKHPSEELPQEKTSSLKKLKNQIEFTFYEELPKQQTQIAVDPDPVRSTEKPNRRYMLQAGSFRKLEDADQLRADLIMKGLSNTKINSVTRSGSTWHRVQIGPFDSKRVMNQARNVLSRNGTDSLVISIKK